MFRSSFRILGALGVIALTGSIAAFRPAESEAPKSQHVLLISVDGLHQTDLAWYVSHRPQSALARLVNHGVDFTQAQTPYPSDSFPGMVGQVTGGNPKTTGVYYDDSYNHALLPAGTTNCATATPGVEVTYFEAAAKNPLSIDSGQGLAGLPDSILNLTGNATSLLHPAALPVDPTTCKPVYPHQYLKVNTVFEVARAAGLRTAWSDKHAAYEIVGGPSGAGVQDFFTPEINSNASFSDAADWTKDNALTQIYDGYKVRAVINEINGLDHSGKHFVGTPAIFGMNFQTISTAQKLPGGGYMADGITPSAMLEGALDYINNQVAAMQEAISDRHLDKNTVIIISAKHGQSPQVPTQLTRIGDGKIIDQLNAAWNAAGHAGTLVAFAVDDDGWIMWTNDRSQAATTFAKNFLLGYNGNGTGSDGKAKATDIFGNAKAYTSAGLATIYSGAAAAAFIGVPAGDARVPDVIGIAQLGTVFTGGQGKIAEHGGDNPPDRAVALVVSGGSVDGGKVRIASVETTQVAPTILQLLGLNPQSLKAVQVENTQVLPLG
ncbi:MAG TPA: alkaline phosphatase family protein [Candidatus Udaeobacter sp.]|nr:alkaline phosphatase family protein [Candidatus Udaeobacter sp.]